MKLKAAPKAAGRPKAQGAATKADPMCMPPAKKGRGANVLPIKPFDDSSCKSLLPRLVDAPVNSDSRTILYLFSGPNRDKDLAHHLRAKGLEDGMVVRVVEIDVVRNSEHDLLRRDLQLVILSDIENCFVEFVVLSPPCASWSRALFNRMVKGPLPLRSKTHPWGFPWLTGVRKAKLMRASTDEVRH